jgi:hypothetical protein
MEPFGAAIGDVLASILLLGRSMDEVSSGLAESVTLAEYHRGWVT